MVRQETPVATALRMSAPETVTNKASPSASIVEPNAAMPMTSAGDSPAIAPRYPDAMAMIRQAAKFPNSTRPTPCDVYGASAPENMNVAKATCEAISPSPEVRPADRLATVFPAERSARRSAAAAARRAFIPAASACCSFPSPSP